MLERPRPLARYLILAASLVCLAQPAAASDPLPLPTIDYEATATLFGGGTVVSRHSKGSFRLEMTMPGVPQAIVSIIDAKARRMLMVLPIPGMAAAFEMELGDEPDQGIVVGRGRRIATATVAGEPCELWEIEPPAEAGRTGTATACLGRDQIPLRVEATIDGKRQVVFEITALKRVPQDPKSFVLPSNLAVMKIRREDLRIPGLPARPKQ